MTFPELLKEGLEPHKVREVLVMDNPEPDKWIDVSDTIEIAIEALKQHVSQVGDAHGDGEWMRKSRRQAGEHHGMKYAESSKHFHFR